MTEFWDAVEDVRRPWIGSSYYLDAEQWTFLFWDKGRPFRRLFDMLDRGAVIELACGHGRHAARAAELVDSLVLVDVIAENLDICRERLRAYPHVTFRLGDGASFPQTGDGSVDAIYCYDAMVHFSPEMVDAYLTDTARVLRRGGRALFHHSNLAAGGGGLWSQNPHARNVMTRDRFARMAQERGLNVIAQEVIDWGGVPELDCISLVGKP